MTAPLVMMAEGIQHMRQWPRLIFGQECTRQSKNGLHLARSAKKRYKTVGRRDAGTSRPLTPVTKPGDRIWVDLVGPLSWITRGTKWTPTVVGALDGGTEKILATSKKAEAAANVFYQGRPHYRTKGNASGLKQWKAQARCLLLSSFGPVDTDRKQMANANGRIGKLVAPCEQF